MSEIAVTNNTIQWAINKGTTSSIAINKSDGWAMYDQIRMEFKELKEVNFPSFLTLTVGAGLTISGNRLIISITYAQSLLFASSVIHADIKLKIGTEVIAPIPFLITITDTVTKLP